MKKARIDTTVKPLLAFDIISKSVHKDFPHAAREWMIVAIYDYYNGKLWSYDRRFAQAAKTLVNYENTCVCDKKNLRYMYMIYNPTTGKFSYPIGSICILSFKNPILTAQLKGYEMWNNLRVKVEKNETLVKGDITRNTIEMFNQQGYITNAEEQEMMTIFNKRNRTTADLARWNQLLNQSLKGMVTIPFNMSKVKLLQDQNKK